MIQRSLTVARQSGYTANDRRPCGHCQRSERNRGVRDEKCKRRSPLPKRRSPRRRPPRPQGYTGLYGWHKYWGKKPYEPLAYAIEQLTRPGDLVVDPFLGSGAVAREATA